MRTINHWEYLACPIRGLIVTGILGNDTHRDRPNGRRIRTSTVISVGIHGANPVAVTASGTAYRLLDPVPVPQEIHLSVSR